MRHLKPGKITDCSPGEFSLFEHHPGRIQYLQIVNIVCVGSKAVMIRILFRNITSHQHRPDDVEKIHILSISAWHSWSLALAANTCPSENSGNLSDETGQTTFHRYSASEENRSIASKHHYFATIGGSHSWVIRLASQLEAGIISKPTI